MSVEALKRKVEDYRGKLKASAGSPIVSSETGPIGISMIDALVATVKSQQRQIDELKRKIADIGAAE